MIEIDDLVARAELRGMVERLTDPSELYEAIGVWQEGRIEERIEVTKMSPDDILWAEWRLPTLHRRMAKGNTYQGILWDEGDLLHSFGFQIGDGVEIGTMLGYAEFLQDGTDNMAARPMVGWSPEDLAELELMSSIFVETGEIHANL